MLKLGAGRPVEACATTAPQASGLSKLIFRKIRFGDGHGCAAKNWFYLPMALTFSQQLGRKGKVASSNPL